MVKKKKKTSMSANGPDIESDTSSSTIQPAMAGFSSASPIFPLVANSKKGFNASLQHGSGQRSVVGQPHPFLGQGQVTKGARFDMRDDTIQGNLGTNALIE
jgi:hypothetical protein